ncbi:hypothetical protein [Chryseobacterium viscerum]|uniref:DUF4394 domain-containing protein n=1 Tax=Chryseobacterium viscerum TaxID=1037377 RepID=A0A316WHN9_9FLAO|nr:hypothetical protein [Chryseobacterium viscerum]PWN59883.1 hypothetical protein C1634_017845 [Chryseobacterium viscerum]
MMNNNFYFLIFFVGFFSSAQVGLNTTAPEATLDMRGKNHLGDVDPKDGILVPRVNALTVNGSVNGQLVYLIADSGVFRKGFHYWNGTAWTAVTKDATNDAWVDDSVGTVVKLGTLSDGSTARPAGTEFSVNDSGRTSIGANDYTAMLTVNSPDTNSILKLKGLSNSGSKTAASIDYNKAYPLYSDSGGNIYYGSNVTQNSSTAATFDGPYTSTPTAQTLVSLNPGSVVKFTVYSGFAFGLPGVGATIYGEVLWSPVNKFQCRYFGTATGGVLTNNLSITGEGTDLLTFDFATGVDFILEKTSAGITYRNTSIPPDPVNIGFSVFNSFRTR